MADFPGYAAAQREYKNRTPYDNEGPSNCADCNGSGDIHRFDGEWLGTCWTCKGSGALNSDGSPFDPNKAENDAADRADMERDERLTRSGGTDPVDESDF